MQGITDSALLRVRAPDALVGLQALERLLDSSDVSHAAAATLAAVLLLLLPPRAGGMPKGWCELR
jgi:hypothetical protein